MTRYPVLMDRADGWTDWERPDHKDYRLACCDCGLIHRMKFRIIKGQVEFKARRDMRATAARRAHLRKQG